MIYLCKSDKFLLFTYPFLYVLNSHSRTNIGIQFTILIGKILFNNLFRYLRNKYNNNCIEYFQYLFELSAYISLKYQMSLINHDELTLINTIHSGICNVLYTSLRITLIISFVAPIVTTIALLMCKPFINYCVSRVQLLIREEIVQERIRQFTETIYSIINGSVTENRNVIKENELQIIAPLLCKSNCANELKEITCAICLDDVTEKNLYRKLPCDHYFHPQCIDKWLLECSISCPLCKINIK